MHQSNYQISLSALEPDVQFELAGGENIADRAGVRVRRVRVSGPVDTKAIFGLFVDGMAIPDYFEFNLDALHESLRDMEWDPAPAYVLIVEEADELWRQAPLLMGRIVNVWLSAALVWRGEGVPFKLVFEFKEAG